MINRVLSTTAIATVIGISLFAPESAKASTLKLVDNLSYDPTTNTFTGDAGSYETRYDVNPGVYGVEVRGGHHNSRRTWELGVGTQTSKPGSFAQGHVEWNDPVEIYDFSINWQVGVDSTVTAKIGDEEVSYTANWEMGDALHFLVKRDAYLKIEEVDGVTFNYEVDQLEENTGSWTNIFITGDSLRDGWLMTGQIGATPHRSSSFNEILFKMGDFTFNIVDPKPVPEPSTIFGLLVALGFGFRLRKVN